ncbi:MAG: ISAs1 family transposase [Hydrococcus sp. CSU_1_8]|nr:ISAs1 family transposase [Hydrococcus sp. CSU_1_8]
MLEQNFQAWSKIITGKLGLEVIGIDGKSLNGSYDRENSLKSLVMVSAWSSSHKLVLGQVAVEQKSNEITAIPVLLEQLDAKGAIVTIDAMGTQTAIARQINSAGADYILTHSIRSHWGVENQLHWCLDVIFAEDDSRIGSGHAPQNMTILKRLALNLLRQDNSKGSLKMKRYQAGLNNNFLFQILSNSGIF